MARGDAIAAVGPNSSLADVREGYDRAARAVAASRPSSLAVEDCAFESVPCRRYTPGHAHGACIVWYHGGGWILGSLDTHDDIVADLADRVGCAFVSVAYRLAPEHPFPAAFHDALAVFEAVRGDAAALQFDPGRLILAGDSAGGNLAAAVTQHCRDRGDAGPSGQLLLYPTLSSDEGLPSRGIELPGWSAADMRRYLELYLGRPGEERDRADARLFPGDAIDLSGLPPTFMSAAEYDPLCSDVTAYAARLRAAGVTVDAIVEAGLPHGWVRARHHASTAAAAFDRVVQAAKRLTTV